MAPLFGSCQGGGDYESRAQDNGPRGKPATADSGEFDDDIPFYARLLSSRTEL